MSNHRSTQSRESVNVAVLFTHKKHRALTARVGIPATIWSGALTYQPKQRQQRDWILARRVKPKLTVGKKVSRKLRREARSFMASDPFLHWREFRYRVVNDDQPGVRQAIATHRPPKSLVKPGLRQGVPAHPATSQRHYSEGGWSNLD